MTELEPRAYQPYADPVDYIIRCTDDMWLHRGVGRIADQYYAADIPVHTPYGTVVGVDPVVEGTLMAIAGYPVRHSIGEDVVWEVRSPSSFISSHRVHNTGLNLGWSTYGPPTGREYSRRALAHCLVQDGVIVEEWLVRDEMVLVQSLGLDADAQAERLATQGAWRPLELGHEITNPLREGVSGTRHPLGEEAEEVVARLVALLREDVNERRFDRVGDVVGQDVVLHTTRGRRVDGRSAWVDDHITQLAPFPDARYEVIDVVAHDDERRHLRVALVWVLRGTYRGLAVYGPTTGCPVEILGCSQYLVDERGQVCEEYRVFDEMALRIQLATRRQELARTEGSHEPVTQPGTEATTDQSAVTAE